MPLTPTTRLGLTQPDGAADLLNSVDDTIRANNVIIDGLDQQGTFAARPAATAVKQGTFYYATDTSTLFRSTGAVWVEIQVGSIVTADIANNAVTAAKVEVQQAWLNATNNLATGTCQYMKDSLGFVHVQVSGSMTATAPLSAGAALFTIPAGYRPGTNVGVGLVSTTANTTHAAYIDTGGVIRYAIANAGSGVIGFYFPALVFKAEN